MTNPNPTLSIKNIYHSAWDHLKGVKWPIWAGLLTAGAIGTVLWLINLALFATIGISIHGNQVIAHTSLMLWITSAFEGLGIFVLAPITAGIQFTALSHLRSVPISSGYSLRYFHKWLPLGLSVLILTVGHLVLDFIMGFLIGFFKGLHLPTVSIIILFLMPLISLIYFSFFVFNLLLIIDRNCGPIEAILKSAKLVRRHYFTVLGIVLTCVLAIAIPVLPLFFASKSNIVELLIVTVTAAVVLFYWVIPFIQLLIAKTYQDLLNSEQASRTQT